jgi:hypothetical protein
MAKVVLDFGLSKSCVVRKLGSGVLTVPGTKYRMPIIIEGIANVDSSREEARTDEITISGLLSIALSTHNYPCPY